MLKETLLGLAVAIGILFVHHHAYNLGQGSNLVVIDHLHSEIDVMTTEYEYLIDLLSQEILSCDERLSNDAF